MAAFQTFTYGRIGGVHRGLELEYYRTRNGSLYLHSALIATPAAGLTGLQTLNFIRAYGVTDLSPLAGLTGLRIYR